MAAEAPARAATGAGNGFEGGTSGDDWPAFLLLLLFVFSLGFMQPAWMLLGFAAVASDFIFAALAVAWALLLLARRASLPFDRAFIFILLYFLAMAASAAVSDLPARSAAKLATQAYLLSLPVVVCSLVRDETRLRAAMTAWLIASAIVVLVAVASLIMFAADPDHPWLRYSRFHFGTLPPGDYPRLRMTFLNANLALNYLVCSMLLLLAARRLGWIGRWGFRLLLSGLVLAGLTTISAGLGGIALGLSAWRWLELRESRPRLGAAILALGAAIALLFIVAMAVTPLIHETAPFLIQVPTTDIVLAPAGRLMTWMEAAKSFLAEPLLGRGIGVDPVSVPFDSPSGRQTLADAHNSFLNIAAQCGAIGLAAFLALVAIAWRRTGPFRLPATGAGIVRLGAGLALLNGLVYQGIGGSFEDSRHLWVVFGLLLASGRIEQAAGKNREEWRTQEDSNL